MTPNGENGNTEPGLTWLEEFVEVLANEHIQFAEEHRRLLTAQVLLTNRKGKLAAAQAHTEDRIAVLIRVNGRLDQTAGVAHRLTLSIGEQCRTCSPDTR